MRLTSRKRHVVASSNGSQLSYHHPTIQAKQNQVSFDIFLINPHGIIFKTKINLMFLDYHFFSQKVT